MRLLDCGDDFRERWRITTWENIAVNPRVRVPGQVRAADRVDQRDTIVSQQFRDFGEIGIEMVHTDMFEHAHRDNPVIFSRFMSVIGNLEPDAIRNARGSGPLVRDLVLIVRKRQSGHICLGNFREIQPEPAPARSDIQNFLARLQQKFRRNMPLLLRLRLLDRVFR